MKKLLGLLALFVAVSINAAIVTQPVIDIIGTDTSPVVTLTPVAAQQSALGSIVYDVPRTVRCTNGVFWANLVGGIYDTSWGSLGLTKRIRVPINDTNTYDFATCSKLAVNAGVDWGTNGWDRISSRLLPGNGYTVITNSPGSIYESLTFSTDAGGGVIRQTNGTASGLTLLGTTTVGDDAPFTVAQTTNGSLQINGEPLGPTYSFDWQEGISGGFHAPYFYGDGSQLTGIDKVTSSQFLSTSNGLQAQISSVWPLASDVSAGGHSLTGGKSLAAQQCYLTNGLAIPFGGVSPVDTNGAILQYDFSEGSGQIVTNRIYASTINTNNLLPLSEGFFKDPSYGGNGTVTEGYALNPLGAETNACRVVMTGTDSGTYGSYRTYGFQHPAAANAWLTYTLYVRANAGTNVNFRFGGNGSFFTDQVATTNWLRFTNSFTGTSNAANAVIWIGTGTNKSPVDLCVWGAQLELGSNATAYARSDTNWNATLGIARLVDYKDPGWTTNGLWKTNGTSARAIASGYAPLSRATVYSIFRRSAGVVSSPTAWLLSHFPDQSLELWEGSFYFGGAAVGLTPAQSWNDGNWHLATGTYDGTNLSLYVDGVRLGSAAASLAPFVWKEAFLFNHEYSWGEGNLSYLSVLTNAHSAAQIASTFLSLSNSMRSRGITLNGMNRHVVFEGDSITGNAGNWAGKALALSTNFYFARNFAVAGSVMANVNSRSNGLIATLGIARTDIATLLIGANDLTASSDTNAFYQSVKAWCRSAKLAGAKVLIGTILPNVNVGFNPRRNAVNDMIRADNTGWYDGIMDFAANSTVGQDSSCSNTTYYSDGVHPTSAGYDILAQIAIAAIDSIPDNTVSSGLSIANPAVLLTSSGDGSFAGTISGSRIKVGSTNGIVVPCPNGGSFILNVGNDGTLSTSTNSTGL